MCSNSVRANDRDLILALDIASVVFNIPEMKERIMAELDITSAEFRRFYTAIEAHLALHQANAC